MSKYLYLLLFGTICRMGAAFTVQRILSSTQTSSILKNSWQSKPNEVLSSSSKTQLSAGTELDITEIALISAAFAGIAVYTYNNPDTSEKIREAFDEIIESAKSSKSEDVAVTATESAVVAAPAPTPAPAPTETKEKQKELNTLLKSVSDTVEEQSAKLDELKSQTTTTTATTSTTTKPAPTVLVPSPEVIDSMRDSGKKRRFVRKLFKKIVMPWKAWQTL